MSWGNLLQSDFSHIHHNLLTSIHPMIVTKLQDIGALEFGFITKGAEYGIGLVKEIQDGIKFRHFPVIHDDDTIVMGLRNGLAWKGSLSF